MANYVYLVGDPDSKECAVVDPAWDVDAIFEAARAGGYRITKVLLTHNHPDHTNGIAGVLERRDIPVFVHADDAFALKAVGKNLRQVDGGQTELLGKMEITFLHTPGHTEGSQCFQFQNRLLTGDTLFIGGCGRVDLPDSDPEKMYHSLRKLAALSDTTLIFPGHNYSPEKSIALLEERDRNSYIRASMTGSATDFKRMVGG